MARRILRAGSRLLALAPLMRRCPQRLRMYLLQLSHPWEWQATSATAEVLPSCCMHAAVSLVVCFSYSQVDEYICRHRIALAHVPAVHARATRQGGRAGEPKGSQALSG